jgi:hypothetical protein
MKFALGLLLFVLAASSAHCEQHKDGMVAYVKGSVPNQIYRCIQRFNVLRCLKYFVLLRLEARDITLAPNNSTTNEFLGNILKNVASLPSEIPEHLAELNDEQLNERLTRGFQKFFHDRPIKLHFIPNMLVQVIPSRSNDLEINLKRTAATATGRQLEKDVKDEENQEDDDDEDYEYEDDTKEADSSSETVNKDSVLPTDDKKDEEMKGDNMKQSGMRKKRGYYLQLGLPLILAPYMVFAGFLPMLIPVLKLATAFTAIVNVTALIASIMYLARQQALEKEMQQTVYFNPGYKERK